MERLSNEDFYRYDLGDVDLLYKPKSEIKVSRFFDTDGDFEAQMVNLETFRYRGVGGLDIIENNNESLELVDELSLSLGQELSDHLVGMVDSEDEFEMEEWGYDAGEEGFDTKNTDLGVFGSVWDAIRLGDILDSQSYRLSTTPKV